MVCQCTGASSSPTATECLRAAARSAYAEEESFLRTLTGGSDEVKATGERATIDGVASST